MSSAPQETCWTLIRAAAHGQAAEREAFTRRYLPAVRAYLAARWKYAPLRSEIDDGVQEVFMVLFKQGGALESADASVGRGFRAFLYGVTRNVALHMERSNARRAARVEPGLGSEPPAADPSLSRVYDQAYARAIMRESSDVMTAKARVSGDAALGRVEILKLRFEQGLPIREIARLWSCDPAELHLEYAKAAREFRAALREVVGVSERCAPDRLDRECDRLLQLLR